MQQTDREELHSKGSTRCTFSQGSVNLYTFMFVFIQKLITDNEMLMPADQTIFKVLLNISWTLRLKEC